MALQSLTVAQEQTRVVLLLDGRRALALSWQMADDLQRALRVQVRLARAFASGQEMPSAEVGIRSGATVLSVRHEAGKVLVIGNGRLLFDMPPGIAERLWRAILIKARGCEEQAKFEAIAADQALLIRTGAPFGLTSHPAIQDEAKKEAGHSRLLRRAIPHARPQAVFGTPAITQFAPTLRRLRA